MAASRRGRWDGKPVRHRFRDALADIEPLEFERLLLRYYQDAGYHVTHSGTGNGASTFDGGVDLRLRKEGRLTLVQCKRENAYQITHNVVHELLGIKVNEGADEAIVITTGEFTEAAMRAGATGHVRLVDGVELRRLLGSRLEDLRPRRTAQASDYVPVWEPLNIVDALPRRSAARNTRDDVGHPDWKFLAALALMLGLSLLQYCSPQRPAASPEARERANQAEAVSPPARTVPSAAKWPQSELPVALQSPVQPTPSTSSRPAQTHRVSAAEQARRDEELRHYLERVPEVTHYRYSPLDQNRDPAPVGPESPGEVR